ncbi:hypothetical protein CAC42_770 [Sphaceloma murrayae]|uniref:Uncharacterized protein n=1 Tax=Sphaceloma murrayae TaxID=2082308 RepID=A0A2K1QKN2_9PEZI|nr:hypothetical protein CAC42_770 [Sphaceloma murrayae]
MPKYSYQVAKDVLSETDKNRILAIYFSMESPNASVDWSVATNTFGAASEESMRVMLRNALKKIKDAGGEIAADGSNIPASVTPKKKGGRKRKTDGEETPESEKKRSKKDAVKKPKNQAIDEEDEAGMGAEDDPFMDDNITVKQEVGETAYMSF